MSAAVSDPAATPVVITDAATSNSPHFQNAPPGQSPEPAWHTPANASDLNTPGAVSPVLPEIVPASPAFNPEREQQLQRALAVANTIDDPLRKATLISDIARQYAELGQPNTAADLLAQALETAKPLKDAAQKRTLLEAIARQYLEIDQPSQVQAIVTDLDDIAAQIALMSALAQYYTETDQPAQAADTLAASVALVETVDDKSLQLGLLTEISLEYSCLEQTETADRLLA